MRVEEEKGYSMEGKNDAQRGEKVELQSAWEEEDKK